MVIMRSRWATPAAQVSTPLRTPPMGPIGNQGSGGLTRVYLGFKGPHPRWRRARPCAGRPWGPSFHFTEGNLGLDKDPTLKTMYLTAAPTVEVSTPSAHAIDEAQSFRLQELGFQPYDLGYQEPHPRWG